MPIEPRELCEFATQWSESKCDEAHLRASISRAYYAIFHAYLPIAEYLPGTARERKDASHITHEELIGRLFEWQVTGLHARLNSLKRRVYAVAVAAEASRKARVKADYKLEMEIEPVEARSQAGRARNLLREAIVIKNEMERVA